jgi:hypothetical protein
MEGHFITGFGDGSASVRNAEPIRLLPDAVAEAELVGRWNARKKRMMGRDHVGIAWAQLREERWLIAPEPTTGR